MNHLQPKRGLMPQTRDFLILFALVFIFTRPGYPSETMSPEFQQDLADAEKCYRLEGRVPGIWGNTDVLLVDTLAPIVVEAELFTSGPLPASLTEVSRAVRWRAEAGQVFNGPGNDAVVRSTWTPPQESRLVKLVAEAAIALEPTERRRGQKPAMIEKAVEFVFLTPLPSTYLKYGVIDNYKIGDYPNPSDPTIAERFKLESNWHELYPERYRLPPFFYRVDRNLKPLTISPHLTLGHFTIDYPWHSLGMPQYVTIDLNLVEKLEEMISLIQRDGAFRVTGLKPIYGFRPPAFNLGTIEAAPDTTLKVPFSMHQFGRALDFIIDENGDDVMDDLNGDGVIDMRDAAAIMHYVNILDRKYREEGQWNKVGGAGLYDHHDFEGRVQTPYIHVDTRGFLRPDKTLVRWPTYWYEGGPPIDWKNM